MLRHTTRFGFSVIELMEGMVAMGLLAAVASLAIILPAINMARLPAGQQEDDDFLASQEIESFDNPFMAPPRRPASEAAHRGPRIPVSQALAELESIRDRFDFAYRAVYARPQVTDQDVEHLVRLIKMGPAEIGKTSDEKSELVYWDWLVNAEVVQLVNTNITDAAILHLNEIATLQELDLNGTRVTDAGVEQLALDLPLRYLNLGNTPISDRAMHAIGRHARLEQLSVCDTQVSDAGIGPLHSCVRLNVLELSGTQITDRGLAAIGQFESLRELSLSGQPITDEGVKLLLQFPELEAVDLRDTQVSDASVGCLKRLYGLSELYIANTRITKRGVDELTNTLRDCNVDDEMK